MLIGMVVVSHGSLAKAFRAATEHVVGAQPQLATVCIEADDDMEARRREIIETARKCDLGKGTIILTDMFGGTPSNLAISAISRGKLEVIAGVNLPMLIKLAEIRGELDILEAAEAAQEAGRRYISIASVLLGKGN